MNFFKFFKRRYPYAPVAFLGRKNVQKMLGADIKKLKNIDKASLEDEETMTQEEKDIAKQARKAEKAKDKGNAKSAKKSAKAKNKDKDGSKQAKKTAKDKDATKSPKKKAKTKDKDAAMLSKQTVDTDDMSFAKPVKEKK